MNPAKKTNYLIEFSLLGLLAILWGSSYFLLKVAVSEIPPLTLIAIRATVAALLLQAILFCINNRCRVISKPGNDC